MLPSTQVVLRLYNSLTHLANSKTNTIKNPLHPSDARLWSVQSGNGERINCAGD